MGLVLLRAASAPAPAAVWALLARDHGTAAAVRTMKAGIGFDFPLLHLLHLLHRSGLCNEREKKKVLYVVADVCGSATERAWRALCSSVNFLVSTPQVERGPLLFLRHARRMRRRAAYHTGDSGEYGHRSGKSRWRRSRVGGHLIPCAKAMIGRAASPYFGSASWRRSLSATSLQLRPLPSARAAVWSTLPCVPLASSLVDAVGA